MNSTSKVQVGEVMGKPFTKKAKLTRKQAAFVKEIINNPKQSATAAALKTYGKPDKELNYNTAHAIASENLQKPAIISHLDSYSDIAEQTITNNMKRFKDSEDIKEVALSVDLAKYIHDKTHGKATIRTENTNLNISIEDLLNNLQ